MIGSDDGLPPQDASAASVSSGDAGELSDDECVQRLQTAVANHSEASPATGAEIPGPQTDSSSDAGELEEVAALIGRLAVPLE